MKSFIFTILWGFSTATMSMAATLSESDVNGGFGATQLSATQVALGNEIVTGTLSRGTADFLRFTNLSGGAQSVTLTFGLLLQNPNSAGSGSGTVTVSALTGVPVQNFNITKGGGPNGTISGITTLTFNLDNSFAGGELLFGLAQTAGNRTVTYAMSIPGNMLPAPVPVPPAGTLLLAAFGGLLAWRRRLQTHRRTQIA